MLLGKTAPDLIQDATNFEGRHADVTRDRLYFSSISSHIFYLPAFVVTLE